MGLLFFSCFLSEQSTESKDSGLCYSVISKCFYRFNTDRFYLSLFKEHLNNVLRLTVTILMLRYFRQGGRGLHNGHWGNGFLAISVFIILLSYLVFGELSIRLLFLFPVEQDTSHPSSIGTPSIVFDPIYGRHPDNVLYFGFLSFLFGSPYDVDITHQVAVDLRVTIL